MRTVHDQLGKQISKLLLSTAGKVEPQRELSAPVRAVDVWFEGPRAGQSLEHLGLFGRLASRACLLEFYSEPPSPMEVRTCATRLYLLHGLLQREAVREHRREYPPVEGKKIVRPKIALPQLWIISAGVPRTVLREMDFEPQPSLGEGVYQGPRGWNVGLVLVSQLAQTLDTLTLRLVGQHMVQRQAIEELLQMRQGTWPRDELLQLISDLQLELLQEPGKLSKSDREILMSIQKTFAKHEQALRQEAHREALITFYEARFEPMPLKLHSKLQKLGESELKGLMPALFGAASAEEFAQRLKGPTQS